MGNIGRAARLKRLTRLAAELFEADDWKILEVTLPDGESIGQHDRLYRSLGFGDDDYAFNVAEVIASLADADEMNLDALERYVSEAYGVSILPVESRGRDAARRCMVFISHKAEEKWYAAMLKDELASYGMDAFVAHEDIVVTAEWEREIERMLRICDGFVYLASQAANASEWCQQEIGWAFGRNIPMLSIGLNANPKGFLGMRQAFTCGQTFQAKDVARAVFEVFSGDERVCEMVANGLIDMLAASAYFDESNRLADLLKALPRISTEQAGRIEAAIASNDQVCCASHGRLPEILRQTIRESAN